MEQNTPRFAFGPRNYRLMFIGLAVLAAGFITMMLDSADYGEGFLGITLGPILLAIGFGIEFWAIMTRADGTAPVAQDAATVNTVPSQTVPPTVAPASPTYKR
ncbi:DUF3098 domain-containing protein [Hymenobacter taeanensis]|uniref:DUF3098 domain-containing protein n=1 Tax=Hymenobacter taeanensis TaxID=2735321 RepID=A0A6M6BDA4_9BACT|nr:MULTISPECIES: DUF3098 domain-containing protein [Hymenobacter]QJX45724.1 DUF3098 domain-containing protein [Hymenobacter taeanensis]UOQ79565.1 DUF3098 domain-containing protein [Hymenobacter sp. 5414T-23]